MVEFNVELAGKVGAENIIGQEPCAPGILEDAIKLEISNTIYYITLCPN
jgi:hypothetical protein